ncbi:SHOCT domain-containing protein [Listeria monocytogenes]|nr:SHOCT domain-containing protein [Listeria monocytogenes]
MNKQLIRNEMLYQMSIQPAKIMLEKVSSPRWSSRK